MTYHYHLFIIDGRIRPVYTSKVRSCCLASCQWTLYSTFPHLPRGLLFSAFNNVPSFESNYVHTAIPNVLSTDLPLEHAIGHMTGPCYMHSWRLAVTGCKERNFVAESPYVAMQLPSLVTRNGAYQLLLTPSSWLEDNGTGDSQNIGQQILPFTVYCAHCCQSSHYCDLACLCPRKENGQRARPACSCLFGDGASGAASVIVESY